MRSTQGFVTSNDIYINNSIALNVFKKFLELTVRKISLVNRMLCYAYFLLKYPQKKPTERLVNLLDSERRLLNRLVNLLGSERRLLSRLVNLLDSE